MLEKIDTLIEKARLKKVAIIVVLAATSLSFLFYLIGYISWWAINGFSLTTFFPFLLYLILATFVVIALLLNRGALIKTAVALFILAAGILSFINLADGQNISLFFDVAVRQYLWAHGAASIFALIVCIFNVIITALFIVAFFFGKRALNLFGFLGGVINIIFECFAFLFVLICTIILGVNQNAIPGAIDAYWPMLIIFLGHIFALSALTFVLLRAYDIDLGNF